MRSLIAALGLFIMPQSASATEEPPHTVIVENGKFELRQYGDMIVAEVEITGDMRRAGNSGFRPLAGYIFGDNMARKSIEMTAPVTRQKSQKIDMTAPVTRVASGNDVWTVAFVMPSEWTMETLPVPNNPDVTLRVEPGQLMATVRFSGRASQKDFNDKVVRCYIAESVSCWACPVGDLFGELDMKRYICQGLPHGEPWWA